MARAITVNATLEADEFLEEYLARLAAKGRHLEPALYDILRDLLISWFKK